MDVLRKLRRPKQKTLPSALTSDEVHRLIGAVKQHRNAAYFWTVYSLGLRLEEGLNPMVYHPHVHFVIPGGGVSQDGSQWQAGPENFLLPEKAASIVYRAKFRDAMREAGFDEIDPDVWKKNWVVDVEAVWDGRATLKYLAPHVYRTAISNNAQRTSGAVLTACERQRTGTVPLQECKASAENVRCSKAQSRRSCDRLSAVPT